MQHAFQQLSPQEQARCVGRNLRAFRQQRNLTMVQLHQIMRKRDSTNAPVLSYIGDIERGEKNPTVQTVLTLAAALEIAPAELFQMPSGETEQAA